MATTSEAAVQPYDGQFYGDLHDRSKANAEAILPLVLEMVPGVRSVVDVGCGAGVWLAEFRRLGVEDFLGLDGDWVLGSGKLAIPRDRFVTTDLNSPIDVGRKFDLAVSFEVGEHLKTECSATFVKSLTGLADVVAFSAAIPGQGGTYHINEQWPDFWVDLFKAEGFEAFDVVRAHVWERPDLGWCRQNILIFARSGANPELSESLRRRVCGPLRIVHPDLYLTRMNHPNLRDADVSVRQAAGLLLRRLKASLGSKSK